MLLGFDLLLHEVRDFGGFPLRMDDWLVKLHCFS